MQHLLSIKKEKKILGFWKKSANWFVFEPVFHDIVSCRLDGHVEDVLDKKTTQGQLKTLMHSMKETGLQMSQTVFAND